MNNITSDDNHTVYFDVNQKSDAEETENTQEQKKFDIIFDETKIILRIDDTKHSLSNKQALMLQRELYKNLRSGK